MLIRRGLRGVLARKRRDPDLRIRFDEVAAVRFAPSGWLVGYLQVIERGASVGSRGYLTTIRDHRTVTFLTRSGRWGRAAEEVAARSDVIVEVAQDFVNSPEDVAQKIVELKQNDRRNAYLMVANTKGELRLVAVPLE